MATTSRADQAENPEFSRSMELIRAKFNIPSLAVAVYADGKLQFASAVGVRKFGDPTSVTTGDKYHIGSCTKSMTSTLAAILVERGKLKWTTTISEIFPELVDKMRPEYRSVSVSMLCGHHAGLSGVSLPGIIDWRKSGIGMGAARLKYVELTLQQPSIAPPGTKFSYANSGYVILGAILERVTKLSWEELMRTMLFEPLGMSSAGFGPMATPGRVDQPYSHIVVGKSVAAVAAGPLSDNPAVIGPAGTVHCSIIDLAKYASFHAMGEDGKGGILGAESFKYLHTPHFTNEYACGWFSLFRPWAAGKALTHNGNNTMNYAVMWLAPKKKIAIVAASNIGAGGVEQACDEAVSAALLEYLASKK